VGFPSIGRLLGGGRRRSAEFSVICAFNDPERLGKFLLPSLRRQGAPFELIAVDTRGGGQAGAAATLNEAAGGARGGYLMFVHQDVALGSDSWLADACRDLGRISRLGAAGVAGAWRGGSVASVSHGDPPRLACPGQIRKPFRVQTLDGCLMIVPGEVFRRVRFDESTCGGWHLYVADYCLDLARLGYRVHVLPHPVYHESTGPKDPGVYEVARRRLLEKHRARESTIYTTVGVWRT